MLPCNFSKLLCRKQPMDNTNTVYIHGHYTFAISTKTAFPTSGTILFPPGDPFYTGRGDADRDGVTDYASSCGTNPTNANSCSCDCRPPRNRIEPPSSLAGGARMPTRRHHHEPGGLEQGHRLDADRANNATINLPPMNESQQYFFTWKAP